MISNIINKKENKKKISLNSWEEILAKINPNQQIIIKTTMHSTDYLQNEVYYKLGHIDEVLIESKEHKDLLSTNVNDVKKTIETVLDHHMKSLQSHAQWLITEADNIYHSKVNTLSQQINQLETASDDLTKSLQMCGQGAKSDVEIRNSLKNAMNKYGNIPSTLPNLDEINFQYNSNDFDETIFGFGRILETKNSFEEPTDSEFEIVPPKKQNKSKNIEMQLKSIEMYHMTAESASLEEKQDMDKIEVELNDLSIKNNEIEQIWLNKKYSKQEKSNVLNIDKETMNLSKWLRFVSESNDEASVRSQDAVQQPHDAVQSKVQTWLKDCDQVKDAWVVKRSTEETVPSIPDRISMTQFDGPVTKWLIKEIKDLPKVGKLPLPIENNERSNTTDLFDNDSCSWVYSSSTISSAKSDKIDAVSVNQTLDTVNKSPSDNWLTSSLSNLSNLSVDSQNTDTPSFLHKNTKKEAVLGKASHVIKHVNFILNQPSNAFLLKADQSKNDSYCDWLIGSSNNRCVDCTEACTFDSPKTNWLKTATDW